MKFWMIALALVAMIGFSGNLAQAKGKKGHGHGIHGKIVSVGADSFLVQTGGKKNPQTLTVKFTASTPITIDGVAGKLDSSLVGKKVKIQGASDGTNVTATAVDVVTVKKAHKAKAGAA